jgi:hypothetical protein
MPRRTRFYGAVGALAVTLALIGFAPGLVSPAHPRQPLTTLVAVHAGLCVAWLAFFLAQTSLVATRRSDVHRRIGWFGAAIAVALVATGYFTAVDMGRRGIALSGDPATARDPLGDLVFPLGDLVTFIVLVAAGLVWRRRRDVHARLMLFGTLGGLMPAALAHLVGYAPPFPGRSLFMPLSLGVLYALHAVHDRLTAGRVHPLSLWLGLGLFVWSNLRAVVVGPSDTWHRFVAWLIR